MLGDTTDIEELLTGVDEPNVDTVSPPDPWHCLRYSPG